MTHELCIVQRVEHGWCPAEAVRCRFVIPGRGSDDPQGSPHRDLYGGFRAQDVHLQVIRWGRRFAIPLRLTFGARPSPGIWERYGFLLEQLFRIWLPDWADLLRWVDDYLVILVCTEEEAAIILSLLRFIADTGFR